ncbi:MAG: NTP transferase domain-containing protein [Opitutales bacterium]
MAESRTWGLVLLAAGASRRMGRPKQLLPVQGMPLVRRVALTALAAPVSPVVVVLGAHAAEVTLALAGLPVCLALNPGWEEGMGSSLRFGAETALGLAPGLQGLIVAMADQPNLTASHLVKLLEKQRETGRSVVATESGGVLQPPVLFTAAHFTQLLALHGETGARAVLQSSAEAPAVVPAADLRDLDTPADYADFIG